jgi:hypothetical protein
VFNQINRERNHLESLRSRLRNQLFPRNWTDLTLADSQPVPPGSGGSFGERGRCGFPSHPVCNSIGVGYFESGVWLQLSGDAANSINPLSRSQAGKYAVSCLFNGNYTITPTTSNTFNYLFQPPSRNFTVVGADVSDLDFQTTAYAITGMIRDTAGNPLGSVGFSVKISNGGISWSLSQDETGTHNFVVPNGTYTLTPAPSCTTCIFTPPNRTIVVNNASVSGQDFVLE